MRGARFVQSVSIARRGCPPTPANSQRPYMAVGGAGYGNSGLVASYAAFSLFHAARSWLLSGCTNDGSNVDVRRLKGSRYGSDMSYRRPMLMVTVGLTFQSS